MGLNLPKAKNIAEKLFHIRNEKEFNQIALEIFQLQYFTNPVYHAYCNAIGRNPENVINVESIPALPIQFFKSYEVKSGEFKEEIVFQSSGTTGAATSRHFVKDVGVYEESFLACFKRFYSEPKDLCILGLLPSYLERGGSSLVYMVERLIKESAHPLSGFYLHDYEKLHDTLKELERTGQPSILLGVTYALLDFAETFPMVLKHTSIIETGGMKGRKKELSKMELYELLRAAFSTDEIGAEYGMTELLSQAYAVNGLYQTPPWMKVVLRDETDPFSPATGSGAINVIDLANLHSCAFIQTDDLGRMHADGRFEVLGRLDNSDIRGCSQLVL